MIQSDLARLSPHLSTLECRASAASACHKLAQDEIVCHDVQLMQALVQLEADLFCFSWKQT